MQIYHHDSAGFYQGRGEAHASPREPGKFLIPARAVTTAPPDEWGTHEWPRWNGAAWIIVRRPVRAEPETSIDKLRTFLNANPDVAALLDGAGNVENE